MEIKWFEDSAISVQITDGGALIRANRGGLLSLAGILTRLSEEQPGSHVHLDAYNSLEDGSSELILERAE